MKAQKELDDVINDLDFKLDNVLKKQEKDYLKSYAVYVKGKEKQLKTIFTQLSAKNSNNTLKD